MRLYDRINNKLESWNEKLDNFNQRHSADRKSVKVFFLVMKDKIQAALQRKEKAEGTDN